MAYYIANRLSHNQMGKIVPGVRRLNTSFAEVLRSLALKQGIKKTQNGEKLEFYLVDDEDFENLTNPATASLIALKDSITFHPLMAIKKDKLELALLRINAKYPNRMDRATYAKYCAERDTAFTPLLVKLNEDVKTERKKHGNPGYKIGDMITHWEHRVMYPAVITKITEAGYQYRVWVPKFHVQRGADMKSWGSNMVGVKAWGDHFDGEVKVPFLANKEQFVLAPKAHVCRWTRCDTEVRTWQESDILYINSWHMD